MLDLMESANFDLREMSETESFFDLNCFNASPFSLDSQSSSQQTQNLQEIDLVQQSDFYGSFSGKEFLCNIKPGESDEELVSAPPKQVIPPVASLDDDGITLEELVSQGVGADEPRRDDETVPYFAANSVATSSPWMSEAELIFRSPSEPITEPVPDVIPEDLPRSSQEGCRRSNANRRPPKRKKYMDDPNSDPTGKTKNAIMAKKNRDRKKEELQSFVLRAETAEQAVREKDATIIRLSTELETVQQEKYLLFLRAQEAEAKLAKQNNVNNFY